MKSPSISTLYVIPFGAPVHALFVQPIHTSGSTFVVAPIHASSVQPIHTLCFTSVIAPIHALPVPSLQPSDNEHEEFLEELPSSKYGEKNPSKIMKNALTM